MKASCNSQSIDEILSDASGEIDMLAEEMQEAFDNTPESLKDSIGRSREIAASELGGIHLPSIPQPLSKEWVTWTEIAPKKKGHPSRPERRDNVVRSLQACLDFLSGIPEDENLKSIKTTLGIAVNNLSLVFFPGMTGK